MVKKKVLVLICFKYELNRIREFYYKYLKQVFEVYYLQEEDYPNGVLNYKRISEKYKPDCLLHPDTGELPRNILDSPWLTGSFQVDTYSGTNQRINVAKLFDFTVVFHPKYDILFQDYGIEKVLVLPHAIDHELFPENNAYPNREIDVSSVGDVKRSNYSVRLKTLEFVEKYFSTNNFRIRYPFKDMLALYQNSKIIVNVGRNDYLQDANLRCFEAMASGAVLVTECPNELSDIGYIDGRDYVSYKDLNDLKNSLDNLLNSPEIAQEIAENGFHKTMKANSYLKRVEELKDFIESNLAVRKRISDNSHLIYAKYFVGQRKIKSTIQYLKKMRVTQYPFIVPKLIKALVSILLKKDFKLLSK